ncbi:MAG: double-strand break repair helicase AddA [Rhodospirillales bacterium]|nr:double-strand break repair helicase AddA [Rhodospirillales bacterium]
MSATLNAPTAQQIEGQTRAADPRQSVWVGANAGTGKTRVLITRILRLMLEGVPVSRILCLTFTKAAAAEMANRLSLQLGAWAVMDQDKLVGELHKLTGEAPEPARIRAARRLFAQTLDAPGGLKIRTIHSFCESLLGRFPIEARIAPHFSVIDERTANELRLEARDILMRRVGDNETDIQQAFSFIAGLVDEEGFDRLMVSLDSNRHQLAELLGRHGGIVGLGRAVRRRLGVEDSDTEETVRTDPTGRNDVALWRAADALDQGTATDQKKSALIRGLLRATTAPEILSLYGAYKSIFVTQKGEASAEARLATQGARKADAAVVEILLAEQDRILGLENRLKGLRIAQATEALVQVGATLISAYSELKAFRALLDYDDLILKTRDLLSDGRVSWVHYKLDGGIDHILVDEAQDTSPEQWQVIAALATDFFSGEGAGDDARLLDRTVFAVGDQKQSIYSFQGADPAKFAEMRGYFAERVQAAERRWQSVELTLSFRSVWAILNTVDAVFTGDGAPKGLQVEDEPIQHLSFRDGQAGLIELWPALTPDDAPHDDPWDAPVDQLSQKSPPVLLAEKIADTLAGWFAKGEPLASTGRNIAPGDVMILLRRRGAFAEEMVRQLKQRRIPVAGSDRMVLLEQMAVMDLVAVGRFALLPDDDLNTAIVLKTPFLGLDDDDLFDLAYGRDRTTTLWQQLRHKRGEQPAYEKAASWLERLAGGADYTPPFEFYGRLLGEGRGRHHLLARLGPDAADPIDEFLSLALSFERDHPPSLEGFLHWLQSGQTQIKRDLEQGRGEVRVMTVHGAKGLQANVVFLPDTCSTPDARLDSRLYWETTGDAPLLFWPVTKDNEESICTGLRNQAKDSALDEYSRLLYVALTRAKDRVYVCGWETTRGRSDGCWYDLVERGLRAQGAQTLDFEDGTTGLRLVTEQTAPPDNPDAPGDDAGAAVALPAWTQQLPPAEPTPALPLNPSRPDGDEPPVRSPLGDDDGARFKRGRLIHRLLQTLPDLAAEQRDDAASRYLALAVHDLAADQQLEIRSETMAVLQDPDLAVLFGPQSRAEVPLVGTVGSGVDAGVISAQIDRLILTDSRIIIVDYKTNRPPPHREADVAPQYLRQMALYRAALKGIYPALRVDTVLLWTDGPSAMWLSDPVLLPYAP